MISSKNHVHGHLASTTVIVDDVAFVDCEHVKQLLSNLLIKKSICHRNIYGLLDPVYLERLYIKFFDKDMHSSCAMTESWASSGVSRGHLNSLDFGNV